jgi:hypothetical protein
MLIGIPRGDLGKIAAGWKAVSLARAVWKAIDALDESKVQLWDPWPI